MIIWGILLGGLVFLKQKWAKALIAVLIVGYIILVFVGINEVPKFAQNKLIFSEIKNAFIVIVIVASVYFLSKKDQSPNKQQEKARKDRKLDSIKNPNIRHSETYLTHSKEILHIDSNVESKENVLLSSKDSIESKEIYQAKSLEKEHTQDITPEVEIIEVKDENKRSKNDRILCSFCGSKNVSNANFCHSCGKSISLDSKDFRESKKEYANNKAGILKYQGLFKFL
ncbi:zinc ribbon domain-containing protein [Helicobacter bilis]|uniref:zinc ribbon domain-containing protein n=1 Tax=Helicobacter bilis TaxID=37372 RepID=UPI0026F1179B|nr:zinc ribbon domain-containing protein [Helicobacter bilis]MCI7411146.1 zinc ribbon domain-containing protein [Helicobacter bilis]MDD7297076.1 zinc ribbon domain-containing protein [Helicobacter bilis]MDY4400736.1 zinc ribbon domain-containing protein [Helicobacter bilis]